MCNTKKTKLQCSGHIYSPSFDTIKNTLPIAPVELHKKNYPRLVNNICVTR